MWQSRALYRRLHEALTLRLRNFAGGIPEIVEHGVTGYLAERSDARQIADYVLSLLRDPDMRQRMGAAGRAAVEEKFDLRKNVAKLIQLYGIP